MAAQHFSSSLLEQFPQRFVGALDRKVAELLCLVDRVLADVDRARIAQKGGR